MRHPWPRPHKFLSFSASQHLASTSGSLFPGLINIPIHGRRSEKITTVIRRWIETRHQETTVPGPPRRRRLRSPRRPQRRCQGPCDGLGESWESAAAVVGGSAAGVRCDGDPPPEATTMTMRSSWPAAPNLQQKSHTRRVLFETERNSSLISTIFSRSWRTSGRAIGTVLRPSVVGVCNVKYCG